MLPIFAFASSECSWNLPETGLLVGFGWDLRSALLPNTLYLKEAGISFAAAETSRFQTKQNQTKIVNATWGKGLFLYDTFYVPTRYLLPGHGTTVFLE